MDVDKFITNVFERRPLWDRKNVEHSNQSHQHKLWDEVSKEMGMPKVLLKEKWRALRQTYRRNHIMHLALNKTPSWRYYNKLSFLKNELTTQYRGSDFCVIPAPRPLASTVPKTKISSFNTSLEDGSLNLATEVRNAIPGSSTSVTNELCLEEAVPGSSNQVTELLHLNNAVPGPLNELLLSFEEAVAGSSVSVTGLPSRNKATSGSPSLENELPLLERAALEPLDSGTELLKTFEEGVAGSSVSVTDLPCPHKAISGSPYLENKIQSLEKAVTEPLDSVTELLKSFEETIDGSSFSVTDLQCINKAISGSLDLTSKLPSIEGAVPGHIDAVDNSLSLEPTTILNDLLSFIEDVPEFSTPVPDLFGLQEDVSGCSDLPTEFLRFEEGIPGPSNTVSEPLSLEQVSAMFPNIENECLTLEQVGLLNKLLDLVATVPASCSAVTELLGLNQDDSTSQNLMTDQLNMEEVVPGNFSTPTPLVNFQKFISESPHLMTELQELKKSVSLNLEEVVPSSSNAVTSSLSFEKYIADLVTEVLSLTRPVANSVAEPLNLQEAVAKPLDFGILLGLKEAIDNPLHLSELLQEPPNTNNSGYEEPQQGSNRNNIVSNHVNDVLNSASPFIHQLSLVRKFNFLKKFLNSLCTDFLEDQPGLIDTQSTNLNSSQQSDFL